MATRPEPQAALVARVRAALPPGSDVRGVAMSGGRAVVLDGTMLVSVGGDRTVAR